jgi:hypothetical protein
VGFHWPLVDLALRPEQVRARGGPWVGQGREKGVPILGARPRHCSALNTLLRVSAAHANL